MTDLKELLDNNRDWAKALVERDAEFFARLSKQQAPDYLWIGCADSRVPANEIVGLLPGELFVHRNVANMVYHTDPNALSVIQFAVEALKVKHIIVCGHYGCGGVKAATEHKELGLIDTWLRGIKDIYQDNLPELDQLEGDDRIDRLCELNVCRQVWNVCHTTFAQNAWRKGQPLSIHGWIYSINDGLLKDLGVTVDSANQLEDIYRYK